MFFELIRGLLLTDGRCFWQVNSGSGVDGSQKQRFHGEAAGCARMSNLHLLKSGIAVLAQDPKLKFTQKNKERGGQKRKERKKEIPLCSVFYLSCQREPPGPDRVKQKNKTPHVFTSVFPHSLFSL